MKYFGKKSMSSVVSVVLHVFWYVVLIGSIIAAIAGPAVLFSGYVQNFISSEMVRKGTSSAKDIKDWETFIHLPLFVKMLALPYVATLAVLLLYIIKKSQSIFTNFKNDIVFSKSNIPLISKTGKLLIVFSIMTCNLNALLVSILLLMLCEIIKNGTALQEEHDLTV